MTQTQDRTTTDVDALARAYILSFAKGEHPERPVEDFGYWEEICSSIERTYEKSNGDMDRVKRFIEQAKKLPPGRLKALLAPTLEEIFAEENQGITCPKLSTIAVLAPDLSKDACPELDQYIEHSREASPEAYDEFHLFDGLWFFSVVAARRVYLEYKDEKIFTNLNIGQYGETTAWAKSWTVRVALRMLERLELDCQLTSDIITPQSLLQGMAGTHMLTVKEYERLSPASKDLTEKEQAMPGQKGMYHDEYGQFMRSMLSKHSTDVLYQRIFLDLDSPRERYSNKTVSRGKDLIEKPYLTILGNVTPPDLKEHAHAGSTLWQNGLFARISWVVAPIATKNDIKDDENEDDDGKIPVPAKLLERVKWWHERLGVPECKFEPQYDEKGNIKNYELARGDFIEHEATIDKEVIRAWKAYRKALKLMRLELPEQQREDLGGSYIRLATTALRIALLLASISNYNHIKIKHWARAQEIAEDLRRNVHLLYARANMSATSETAKIEEEIKRLLQKAADNGRTQGMLPSEFKSNSRTFRHIEITRFGEILSKMKQAGDLDGEQTPYKKTRYKLAAKN